MEEKKEDEEGEEEEEENADEDEEEGKYETTMTTNIQITMTTTPRDPGTFLAKLLLTKQTIHNHIYIYGGGQTSPHI